MTDRGRRADTADLDSRARAWRHPLAVVAGGLLVAETVTGLMIYLLPFGLPLQLAVLVHTAAGLVFTAPYLVYQVRHWDEYRAAAWTHVKLTGYCALAATAVCTITGLVLTLQAAFGRRIGYAWDAAHVVGTFSLLAAAVPHVGVLLLRNWRARQGEGGGVLAAAQNRWLVGASGVTAVVLAAVGLWGWVYEPVVFDNRFPEDYELVYGPDRPFAPSLATTVSGGAYDPRSLSGSFSCGSGGCHEQIVREWEVSAHRYAAMDPAFQAVQRVMAEQNGAESTRYCGGCHDPISLFSGTKNIFAENLTGLDGYREGVSCIACHAIQETDVKGNANYTLRQPERYAYELAEEDAAATIFLRDFLIRAYPQPHVESLSHRMFKSPEFCAACHKQFIDAEINQVGWVQLQNQYDNWRKSRWNHPGDPAQTTECRECHMPLVSESTEPGSGDALDYNRSPDDGRHRSHRFLGANQFVPEWLDLPGAAEHTRLTEQWLRGEIPVPEIAHKWTEGRAVPIELVLPEAVEPGEEVKVRVSVTNNKAGHDFPTGPLDIIQAWIEVRVTDEAGQVVYETGTLDTSHFIAPGSFIYKAEPVDQYGNLIDRHNLWEMVGVRFKRSLFPGFADQAVFSFSCPGSLASPRSSLPSEQTFSLPPADDATELRVTARLLYRKVDQYLLDFLTGTPGAVTAPVTALSEASGTIAVRTADAGTDEAPGQRIAPGAGS